MACGLHLSKAVAKYKPKWAGRGGREEQGGARCRVRGGTQAAGAEACGAGVGGTGRASEEPKGGWA